MNDRKIKLEAVLFSVGIHAFFVLWATSFEIPGVVAQFEKQESLYQVKVVKEDTARFERRKAAQGSLTESLQFEKPDISERSGAPPKGTQRDIEGKDSPLNRKPDVDLFALQRDKDYQIPEARDAETFLRKPQKRQVREAQFSVSQIRTVTAESGPSTGLDVEGINREFLNKMPGLTPARKPDEFRPISSVMQRIPDVPKEYSPVIKKKEEREGLEEDLLWSLSTYQDPDDKKKYFQISIKTGENTSDLPTIPKEILFLVDASISIEEERLEEFKAGLEYCLRHLNEDDIFNVIVFKERTISFRREPVPASEKNIKAALRFIGEISAGEKTDTFGALLETIEDAKRRDPSYIIFLSDGRPTKGVTDSREIINRISELNRGKTSIFTFSGGLRVNRYLLDFIAYKNRGWAEHSYRTHQIDDNLKAMYDKLDEPIILNMRYLISGVDNDEVFPQILPDFFREAEFTVYGQYGDEADFALQLLGEIKGETREFLIKGNFPTEHRGNKQIARLWAFNKIYHLIGRLEHEKTNPELIDQIRYLKGKFDIETPYDKELGE